MVNVRLHIEQLVVEGLSLDPRQGAQLQAAVQRELQRLLEAGGVPPQLQSGLSVPEVRAPQLRLEGELRPQQLGRRIAQSIYRGMAP
jgi:hypothetical protein